jgi:hypothetical protein
MAKWIVAAVGVLVFASLMQIGCKEEMVGAPCVPETDRGDFSANLEGTTWSIETRSVQCDTRLCVTKTAPNPVADEVIAACVAAAGASGGADAGTGTAEEIMAACWESEGGAVQAKYSFCSCRCKDIAGHTYNTNPDKYDYLCECPPNTKCVDVLSDIEEAPDKVKGSYCVPNCIAGGECYPQPNDDGDLTNYMCTPSKDSEKPWQWACSEFDPTPSEEE